MSLESKVNTWTRESDSLRTTVPEGIVAFLGVEKGDMLVWRMEFVNEERVVFVTKK